VVGLEWYPCCRLKPATRLVPAVWNSSLISNVLFSCVSLWSVYESDVIWRVNRM